jgi:hypothetical protein
MPLPQLITWLINLALFYKSTTIYLSVLLRSPLANLIDEHIPYRSAHRPLVNPICELDLVFTTTQWTIALFLGASCSPIHVLFLCLLSGAPLMSGFLCLFSTCLFRDSFTTAACLCSLCRLFVDLCEPKLCTIPGQLSYCPFFILLCSITLAVWLGALNELNRWA